MILKAMAQSWCDELELHINKAKSRIESIKDAEIQTSNFLKCCEAVGITRVGVGITDGSIPGTSHWHGRSWSVFADGRKDGFPAIWEAANAAGIGAGCGNTNQHQANLSRLIEGIYQFKDGIWEFVGDGDNS